MIKERKPDADDLYLAKVALNVKKNAHVIWGFSVGAAVLAADGRIYEGCNIESRISGLGVCAERCAIDHAILHGNKSIEKVAIVLDDRNVLNSTPCGACLQYIYDFSYGKATVVTALAKNETLLSESIKIKSITQLLPFPPKPKRAHRKYQSAYKDSARADSLRKI